MKFLFIITYCFTVSLNCTQTYDRFTGKMTDSGLAVYCPITIEFCDETKTFTNRELAFKFSKTVKYAQMDSLKIIKN